MADLLDRILGASSAVADEIKALEQQLPSLHSLCRRNEHPSLDRAAAYLGALNPLARTYDPATEKLWLLDNTAFRPTTSEFAGRSTSSSGEDREVEAEEAEHHWHAEFVAAFFARGRISEDVGNAVSEIAQRVGLADDDRGMTATEKKRLIESRVQPFLDRILAARTVDVRAGQASRTLTLGPSGPNGIASPVKKVRGPFSHGETVVTRAVAGEGEEGDEKAQTRFVERGGWGFISDIDDSIKITRTAEELGMIKTTFAEPAQPISGMSELYAHIDTILDRPAFFYVSASPYNLYPFLRQFREDHYPGGTIILRDSSWMNVAGFLSQYEEGVQAFKVARCEKIHGWLPDRRFMCLGDSTQSDPETYGEMYRRNPDWIKRIFIRRVTGVKQMDVKTKNAPARFEKAFRGVPRDVWHVFDEPAELYAIVDEAARTL